MKLLNQSTDGDILQKCRLHEEFPTLAARNIKFRQIKQLTVAFLLKIEPASAYSTMILGVMFSKGRKSSDRTNE